MTWLAKQPRWGDIEQTFIICTVVSKDDGDIEFNAMPTDPDPDGRELYARCLAGEFGEMAPYRPNAASLLAERDQRLTRAQAETAGLAEAFVAGLLNDEQTAHFKAWAAYQRDLVALPCQPDFPEAIVWPQPPTDESTSGRRSSA